MLDVAGLTKRFGDVAALNGCTFTAARGRILGLLGPNGAGKTTTMRTIFGLVTPDTGHVTWDGRPVTLRERLTFGYMPEQRGLYPRMKIADQLIYFGELHGLSRADARTATDRWLDHLGLGDRAGARLEELSHGNQQRVQLAAALLHEPALVILDEPFSGLDPLAVQTLQELVREQATRNTAIVFSSHQLDLVEDLCQDIAIINRGRVVVAGELETIRRQTPIRYIDVGITGAPRGWTPQLEGAEVVTREDGGVRLRVTADVDVARVLELARQSGPLEYFRYEPPNLTDIFLEAVRGDA